LLDREEIDEAVNNDDKYGGLNDIEEREYMIGRVD